MEKEIAKNEKIFQLTPTMLESIKRAEEDIKSCRLIPHEEVMERDRKWLSSK